MNNIFVPPAIESLFSSLDPVWPADILDKTELQFLIKERLVLCENLNYLFDQLVVSPDISVVINKTEVNSEKIVAVYHDLVNFISSNEVNRRLILYLPFEIIPDADFVARDVVLQQTIANFLTAYLDAWKKLLFILEFRANFSDGDIPESVLSSKSYLVCKAAHLIPVLLKKKLISVSSILAFLKGVSSEVMRNSIMEGLLAAADLDVFSATDFNSLSNSQAYISASLLIGLERKFAEPEFTLVSDEESLAALTNQAVAKCSENYNDCVKRLSETEPNRIDWEEGVSRQKIIKEYAVIITNSLISGSLAMTTFEEYINSSHDKYAILLAVNSLKVTTEKMNQFNDPLATFNACYFQDWLFSNWQSGDVEIKKIIESTVYRWFHDEIVGWDYLATFDLKPIDLAESTPTEQVCSSSEFTELAGIIELIKNTPDLARYLYPVFIIYGSRVKGQGSKYSDLDLAVFIKPGVTLSDQSTADSLLSEILKLEKIKGKVLQFWLTESINHLSVNNCVPGDYKIIGNSSYGHVLFGGAWFGDFKIIKELHAKLLTPYLFSDDKALKNVCLRELERDRLQYRLLHKGYGYFFSRRGGLRTQYIDADSLFYDSGYRQLATKLFIKKVFLPNLSV